ncbi:hypothetical protein [Pseudalkalibacillus sp. SCS-8]|uniref:hypothetical protein n=1 Tax=Pseudalkalibacillus nanhaiensis TaxID=3115291 RepID=UPI0032DA9ECA
MRQNNMWEPAATAINRSLYGELMVCSMSTQLFYIPETANLKGNEQMHTHLVPASYHRVTASGAALRLMNGNTSESLLQTYIGCIKNAEKQDKEVRSNLMIMLDDSPNSYKTFIETIIRWQDYAEFHLEDAKQSAMKITGDNVW